MSDLDMNKIEFHAVVITLRVRIVQSNFNVLSYEQEEQARGLGSLIASTKGWTVEPDGENVSSRLDLFVFTEKELNQYIDKILEGK